MLGKLIGLVTVGSTMASGMGLLHRFLIGLVTVVILGVISAFMLCGLLISLLYVIYFCLLHYGVDPDSAAISVGVLALLITGGFLTTTVIKFRELRELPARHVPHRASSGLPDLGYMADAFLDGFLNPRR